MHIEGAFNNVDTDGIVRALDSLKLGRNIVRFIELLLKSRIGANNCQRMVGRVTPQGGVLLPLLWNLAANSLLWVLEHSGLCRRHCNYRF